MNKILNSIYSDSTKFYVSNPYPKKGETITIRLRVMENDVIDKILLRYKKFGVEVLTDMEVIKTENHMTYYQAEAECLEDKLNYQFYITAGDKLYFYTQYRITDYLPDESKDFTIFVDYDGPQWMRDTYFYQILPDRFYNARPDLTVKPGSYTYQGHKPYVEKWGNVPKEYNESHCMDFYGGDLYGVIEKLDYLQELGVNGIYLNPIFTSPTMHKYDALDYFEVDPSLGGEEALIKLSDEMHKRGMKLMLDISVNHTSSAAKWFNKKGEFYRKDIGAYNNPLSEERNYYFIDKDGSYEAWWKIETMPSLNYSSQELKNKIYIDDDSVLKKWMKSPYNIDGWRFDVADVMARNERVNVYYDLWEDINKELKSVNPEAIILAEEWSDATEMYNGSRWDSTMNYFSCARPIREFAGEGDLFVNRNPGLAKINYKTTGQHLKNRILQFAEKVPGQIQYQMMNLIDSHDVSRLHNNSFVDIDLYKGAVITLFGQPGAVSVYYGDEKYLDGRVNSNEGCRYPMDWSQDLPSDKKEIFDLYKIMGNFKSKNETFKSGGFKIVHASETTFAFTRFLDDEVFLFIWDKDKSAEEKEIEFPLYEYGMQDSKVKILLGDNHFYKENDMLKIKVKPGKACLMHFTL